MQPTHGIGANRQPEVQARVRAALCTRFEARVAELNPGIETPTYRLEDIYGWIDTMVGDWACPSPPPRPPSHLLSVLSSLPGHQRCLLRSYCQQCFFKKVSTTPNTRCACCTFSWRGRIVLLTRPIPLTLWWRCCAE